MIANISPAASTFEDTYNTLKYANRAKKIKTNLSRNVLSVQYHISKYSGIISNLRNEINELKSQLLKKDKNSSESTANLLTKKISDTSIQNFEKAVNELKNICEEEISLKNRLYDQEQTCYNLKLTQSNILDIDENDPLSIKGLTKKIENTKDKLKQYSKKRGEMMTQWNKSNNSANDLQTKYLNSIIKEQNIKLYQIENKIKENYNVEVVNNKESYINDLENQIKIRDQILNKNRLMEELSEPVKSIDEIKRDYSKLPMIYVKEKSEDLSQLVYVNRNLLLPPVQVKDTIDTSVNHGYVSHSNKIKKVNKNLSNNINLNYQRGNN
jgi:kinesin family protein 18/19